MKITILTIGSRGDIQPFVALAIGLKNKGHQVSIATHHPFQNGHFGKRASFIIRKYFGECEDTRCALDELLENNDE